MSDIRGRIMESTDSTSGSGSSKGRKYKLHWHVLLTHFPIATFSGAFFFMLLHVITKNSCFDLAAYVSLIAGVVVLVPTTATGWYTWTRTYKGFKNSLFRIKIWTSFAMIPISVALVIYHAVYPFDQLDPAYSLAHVTYFAGLLLLMAGSVVEGYWGARLHHR